MTYAGTDVAWWVPALLLGLVSSALPYVAGIEASRRLGSRVSSFVALLEVLCAILFAWALLGELPGVTQAVGGALVLAGVVLVKLGEPAETAAVIAVGDKAHEQYAMVLPTDRASFPTGLADFDVFVSEGLGKALQDSKVSEPQEIHLGGYRAIRRSISGMRGGHRTAYEQVVIETHSTYYQMLLWTIFSHRSAAEREFNDIIASFAAESAPALPEENENR